MYGLDGSKYPARMGKAWAEEEVSQLLSLVRKKKTIEEIASEHERTTGGINAKLKDISADYWFNNKLPIEKIQKFTGLSEETIKDAIERRSFVQKIKERKKDLKEYAKMPNQLEAYTESLSGEKSEIAELKNEIQQLKKEIQDMKNDTKEVLSLIHAIYEVETIEE